MATTVLWFAVAAAEDRPQSGSESRYVHVIDLYDYDNRRIDAESTKPYSPRLTCGRCHDYETISGGWHFNAFDSQKSVSDGRTGEPWLWVDARTGTSLPLSYRQWPDRFDPDSIGITPFEMTRHFGGRLPGGGAGEPDEEAVAAEDSRWPLSGPLEIDCMVCHAMDGQYDFESRREQIEDENFAWSATAAMRWGNINGSVARIKTGSDPAAEATQKKLPQVEYSADVFKLDGKVRVDMLRSPSNNACYQCHSRQTVGADGIDSRWIHDGDVHLVSGMSCTDCHRNGIGHHTVRGFVGEQHPVADVATLSCVGCHLGTDEHAAEKDSGIAGRAGRLGSPYPLHKGLPPIHFEQMTCTSCHGGPIPEMAAGGVLTSMAHHLGVAEHRTGFEMPEIRGPIYAPAVDHAEDNPSLSIKPTKTDKRHSHSNGRGHRHRMTSPQHITWASFFGFVDGDRIRPLHPERVYEETRRSLRVRKDFVEELLQPEEEDREEVSQEFAEKIAAALEVIGRTFDVVQPVFISGGKVWGLRPGKPDSNATVAMLDHTSLRLATWHDDTVADDAVGVGAIRWPLAHNVRPAGWSLGSGGCLECHVDDGKIFASTVTPAGPSPIAFRGGLRSEDAEEVGQPITMSHLRGVDERQRKIWNGLFGGRKTFKYLTGASLLATVMIGFITVIRRHERLIPKSETTLDERDENV